MSEAGGFTHDAIVDVWRKFIESFMVAETRFYFEKIHTLQNLQLKTIYVDYNHLVEASMVNDEGLNMLCKLVVHETDEARETLKEACLALLKEVNPIYAQHIEKTFRAEFKNAPIEKEMTEFDTEDVGKLMRTTGFVTEYDETSSSMIHWIAWKCPDEHFTRTEMPVKPTKCKVNDCGSPILTVDELKSYSEDFIRMKIQQRSDRTAEAKSPVMMEIETIGPDNVRFVKEKIKFGQYVGIDGIVRNRYVKKTSGQGKALAEQYIEALAIEVLPDSYLIADDPEYAERVKFTIRPGSENDPQSIERELQDLDKMIRSMFTSVKLPDTDLMKEICLMQLVGSNPLIQPDGTRIRGEIQMLIIGDPGIAKSRIAEFYKHARKRVMYNSSGKSSSVGLVGGMKMDRDGRWQIASGVFGLAGDGIVILDEFAGRPDSDYSDLLEPLGDTQSITIAKGTHYRQENVNTAVLAIANAATFSRYYDVTKNIYDNTKIPTPILQRMDAILIRKDIPDAVEDEAKARHFFDMQKKSVSEADYKKGHIENIKFKDDDYYPLGYVAKWLAYVRETFHPRVTDNPEAVQKIIEWYLKWRKFSITISKDAKNSELGGMTIPGADMRRLASVMRFANAHARACQRDFVHIRDVERAIMYVELTSAEAGVWKESQSGDKEFVKDELAKMHQKEVDRAAKMERKKFANVIMNLAWRKCDRCKGTGEYNAIGGEIGTPCDNGCDGGFFEERFSWNNAYSLLVDSKTLGSKAFGIIWDEKMKAGEIVKDPYFVEKYKWTVPRYAITASGARAQTDEEISKQMLRDRLKGINPKRAKQLDRIE